MGKKRMKRRLTAILLCAAVSLTSVPFPSFGTETAVPLKGSPETAEAAGEKTEAAEKADRTGGAGEKNTPSVFYVSESGSDRSGDGSADFPYASVQKAYDETEETGHIIVTGTIVIEDYMDILRFEEDKSVRITGENDGCIVYDGDQNIDPASAVMTVSAGSVQLSDITVKMPDIRGKNGRVLHVSGTAEVTVGEAAVIENGYLASSSGNIFAADGGTVILDGGTVRNGYLAISNADAYGAGVFVGDGGTFLMKSGEITGNTARATVSSYSTFGGGAAVAAGGTFVMTGGTISGNEAEGGGGGFYIQNGASVTFDASVSGGSPAITDNFLRKNGVREENNLYFGGKATAFLSGSMAGAEIGVTCEDDYYGRVVFQPSGGNVISAADEEAFYYDGGAYDIRLDSFIDAKGNLILWYRMVDVDIIGDHITSSNPAEETPADLDYETVITADEGYRLPEKISVQTGEKNLSEEEYVWDPQTGQLLIEAEQIGGDIVIRIDAVEETETYVGYTICHYVERVDSGSNPETETSGPDTVTVTDASGTERTYYLYTEVTYHDGVPGSLQDLKDCLMDCGEAAMHTLSIGGFIPADFNEYEHEIEEDGSTVISWYYNRSDVDVHFDGNGGTPSQTEMTVKYGSCFGKLASASRSGYTFDGWYTEKDGGTEVTSDQICMETEEITLYARWTKNGSGGGGGTAHEPQNPPSSGGGTGGSGSGDRPQEDDSQQDDPQQNTGQALLTGEHIRYMQGYPDLTFRPDGNMTRAEAAQMFCNLLSEKTDAASVSYSDVKASAWYAGAVGILSELGIVKGYEDGSFRPDDEISRAEFVAMISRFFDMKPAQDCEFPDIEEECWYYDIVASASSQGWITGYGDGTFRPESSISRAEVAAVTNRALGRSADAEFIRQHREELISFPDLAESHWAYHTVMETVNGHDYEKGEETEEIWTGLK